MNPYNRRIGTGTGFADTTTEYGYTVGAYYIPKSWADPYRGLVTVYSDAGNFRLYPQEARDLAALLLRMACEVDNS
jgi:hypothetical protein